jgi:plasmid stabilization system protein ParE
MNKIKLSPKADEEYTQSAVWYEIQNPGLGARFILAIEEALVVIQNSPESFAFKHGRFRQFVVNRFPFVIVYVYNKDNHVISIVSIYHTSRNPKGKFRAK